MSQRSVYAIVGLITVISLAMTMAPPAHAGYATRLIFQFDIGDARSLPWGAEWWRGRPDYNLAHLLADADALLTPSTPIVVRLETLRRAALYASTDRKVAESLLRTFTDRAKRAGQSDPIAQLDLAFVVDTFWQIGEHYNMPLTDQSRQVRGLVSGGDGYLLIEKSLASWPKDPALQFGAALIAGVRDLGGAAFVEHAQKARAGAARDPLIARNLDRIYERRIEGVTP